jgi:hypothetical protein
MAHLGWEAECFGRVELHHPRDGEGAAQRASDWNVLPLCHAHHDPQSPLSIHRMKSFYARTKLDEWDLIAERTRLLERRQV